MRNHNNGHSKRLIEFANEFHDLGTCVTVQVPGRLISEEYLGSIYQCSRQGGTLLFSAGKFNRPMLQAGSETDFGQCFSR